ncbi:MAG TPA: acyl carrier protein [Gemmatimonadaceae bacterium]
MAEPKWDSLAHATLVSAIESEFGINVDLTDALEMTSFDAARLLVEERSA